MDECCQEAGVAAAMASAGGPGLDALDLAGEVIVPS
jgi:hypothetical protein